MRIVCKANKVRIRNSKYKTNLDARKSGNSNLAQIFVFIRVQVWCINSVSV